MVCDLKPIAEKIREADAILIGASNGLSITEGLHLFADDPAFERWFGDFKKNTACGACCRGWRPAGRRKKKSGHSGLG